MDTKKILSADVLDIIFDGRNKAYGAYDLRKTYNKRITTALLIMLAVCLCTGVSYALTKSKKVINIPQTFVDDINLKKADIPEEKKIELPPPPPLPKQEVPKVEITQFTPPVIVQDKDVTTPPPDVDKLADTKIGTFNRDGEKDNGIEAPTSLVENTGVGIDKPKLNDEDIICNFGTVQIEAEFPGGKDAWRKYLERNLNNTLPSENGAGTGLYSVDLSFVVDKEGNISDIQVEHDPGYGTKDEAIRILKKSPKWNAAIQNGRKVAYRAKQRISFRVEAE